MILITGWTLSITYLHAAYLCRYPKSAKRLSSHQCLCALLGSAHIKAARKALVKSTLTRHDRAIQLVKYVEIKF